MRDRGFGMAWVVAAAIAVGACGTNSPAGPTLDVEGTYTGQWTFDVFIEGEFESRSVCSGSITLAGQSGSSFGGAFLVQDEGDCAGLAPISGDVLEGTVRADGGVEFLLSRIPVVGIGVAGCAVVVDVEQGGEASGAVSGPELSVLAVVGLDCGDRGTGSAQITMTGVR